jgi:adenine-specific DNA-methyltransferase
VGATPQYRGQLELTWTNKDERLLSNEDGSYEWVPPSDYRVSEVRLLNDATSVGVTDSKRAADNLLIRGDALHALTSLAELSEFAVEYQKRVKLVYIDPPFNTGQAFAHYDDGLEHSVWLTMMRDRLEQVKKLLSDDGSVWVHLDDAEAAYCKVLMDAVFGRQNFVGTVVWEKADSPRNSARQFSTDQDYILVYSMDPGWKPNRLPRTAASDAIYSNPDGDERGDWYPGDPFANKPYSKGLYTITGPTGRDFKPPDGRYWRISEEVFWELDRDGRIWWGPSLDARPSIKRYLTEVAELVPRTLWSRHDVGSNRTSKNESRALFPGRPAFATPKPEALLERIIRLGTRPGDIVLDCFAGSGTTAAVAHKMGRRWLAIEFSRETVETYALTRLQKVVEGTDDGGITILKERVAAEELPDGVTPVEAAKFLAVLKKFMTRDAPMEEKEGAGGDDADDDEDEDLDEGWDDDESETAFDAESGGNLENVRAKAAKDFVKTLRRDAKTRIVKTKLWEGGGGFRVLDVAPSMFENQDGFVTIAAWATNGKLAEATAAQLHFEFESDPPFVGRKGRSRLAVVDGLVNADVATLLVSALDDDERLTLCGTAVDPAVRGILKALRSGSTVRKIPSSILAAYRQSSPWTPSRSALVRAASTETTPVQQTEAPAGTSRDEVGLSAQMTAAPEQQAEGVAFATGARSE